MSMISTVLKTRNQHRYKYGKKLSAVLLLLLTWVPINYSHAEEKSCIEGEYEYEKIMYDIIYKKIKDIRFPRECNIIVDVDLPLGLIVGKIKFTNTPSCQRVANIVRDVSEYRMSECYDGHLTKDNSWRYVLIFGKN